MIGDLKPYPAMRDSGVKWLGEVPEHWEIHRLLNTVAMRVSNVDKHVHEEEEPVRLCNYVDVYKNDHITQGINFMQATATREEIERFRLEPGDVLITKDSESWDDIGVPALVTESADDLICGYHLALLRPFADVLAGGYLLRALQSSSLAYQFHVEAKGVTRYGLSYAGMKSVWIPLPPLSEQAAIVRYLDHFDRRVRRLARAKRKLTALLMEQKQAITHGAITRGLNHAPLHDSGVGWLGEVPDHWDVRRLKTLFREVDERTSTGEETLLSLRMYEGLVPHEEVSDKPVSPSQLVGYKKVKPGQLVMNRMRAAIGIVGTPLQAGLVSPDYAIFDSIESLDLTYYLRLFKTSVMCGEFRVGSKGLGTGSSGFMRLYSDEFGTIWAPFPPPAEQADIVKHIDRRVEDIGTAIGRAESEIELLSEYRARLTTDVVTGKLDVREAAAALPDVRPPDAEDDLDDAVDVANSESLDNSDAIPEEAEG